jgi:hypothetical protein
VKRIQRTAKAPGEPKASNGWRTPPACFAALDAEFEFSIDLAADETNHLCPLWLGPGGRYHDALDPAAEWAALARSVHPRHPAGFLNTPYSADLIGGFMQRARFESFHGLTVVTLIPDTHDTRWYRTLEQASEIRRIPHRVPYLTSDGQTKAGAMFPSRVAVFRPSPGVQHGAPRIVSWTWRTAA